MTQNGWRLVLVAMIAALGFVNEAHAGSIGLMAAGAEDPMFDGFCTGSGAPAACCSSSGAGTCGNINEICTASTAPLSCCTGSGAGTCVDIPATSGRTQYASNKHRWIAADFADPNTTTVGDRCILWHFPMPPDYAQSELKWYLDTYWTNAAAAQNVRWRVDFAHVSDLGAYSNLTWVGGQEQDQSQVAATVGSQDRISCTASNCINGDGAGVNGLNEIAIRLCRSQSTSDTYAAPISALSLTIEY